MGVKNKHPQAAPNPRIETSYFTKLAQVVNGMRQTLNSANQVTLTAGATSTTVNDPNCTLDSVVKLTPTTADAGLANAGLWVVAGSGSFVIHHAAAAATDSTFRYMVFD